MGEKGDERQLLALLNAVLSRTGKGRYLKTRIYPPRWPGGRASENSRSIWAPLTVTSRLFRSSLIP
jgi:hypothetical protein